MTTALTATGPVIVSDFDGTMTRNDFYKLAIERLLPPDMPDYWEGYRDGTLTHFEALRRYFAAIRATEADVLAVVRDMQLDPELPTAVRQLQDAGWTIVVTSAGCDWYIRKLLSEAGVDVTVYSNPGRFEPGRGLLMSMPPAGPFRSETLGVDKTAIIRHYLKCGGSVAFAGDGFPDADPARLVPDELRFARADLADVLRREGHAFHPFDRWSGIAETLLRRR
jgi:2,3-diketo-5-methylthio-1-phosphopentane phosphatase